jgi:predicted TIM-barrel fold metal-dependent hydrolase
MNKTPTCDRRQFFERAIAATAAGGLARVGAAEETAASPRIEGFVDTHVYIGNWPHASLPAEPIQLAALLRQNRVSQAWVSSFDGLFHKDIAAVNQRLAEGCGRQSDGSLIPFGAVNPALPDWEDDIRRCHEQFHMPGIRLHPNYHGYTLDDSRFARLLDLAAKRKLIVQLVAWLDDARRKLLTPSVAQVDLKPLANVVAKLPQLRLVIAGGARSDDDELARNIQPLKHVYFDCARLDDADSMTKLVNSQSAERIIFGSAAPLRSIEPVRQRLQNAALQDYQRKAIAVDVATRLIGDRKASK